ncbi:MAG TPA: hypothetical protein VMZ25_03970 [Terriglobales bacterium]|nr:hypothetical protein [Terriglobales bacterium]
MLKLLQHLEGDGVFASGEQSLPVRYCLDLWQETIPLGSGRSGGMKRADGFIWSLENNFPGGKGQTLTLEDGRKLDVRLDGAASGRAKFSTLSEVPP